MIIKQAVFYGQPVLLLINSTRLVLYKLECFSYPASLNVSIV